jgi:hypothetical protein
MTRKWRAVALVSASAIGLTACATPQVMANRPDSLSLGRNAAGETCTASRNWRDPALADQFDQSWTMTCRNVAASRPLGSIRVVQSEAAAAKLEEALSCGAARPATLPAIGEVQARRCTDAQLAADTVAYRFKNGGNIVLVSAAPSLLGPAEEAARIISERAPASADADRATTSAIDLAALGVSAGTATAAPAGTSAAAFDAAAPLADGINLNHKGLHVEASRVLNDALSRLPASAAPSTRAELLLEAGLADSNIKFQDSATQHFAEADRLIAGVDGERSLFLQRKRDAYRALDLLNQRKFREALAALDRLVSRPTAASQPLQDPAIIRVLNQAQRRGDVSSSIAVPETAALAQLVLDAQANWARSVALFALGDVRQSSEAIGRATAAYQPLLNERIDPTLILWLGAHIDRQRGRLEARIKDYPAAIASFDRALAQLRRSAVATAGTGNEPSIAETQLERAGIIAEQAADPVLVRNEYDSAVDAMIAANQAGGGFLPAGIERYLDLLVGEANGTPRADTDERFFRAMQVVGEPAVARQLSQLQSVVSSDPAVGVKVRDRAELERTITRLRYEIAAGGSGGTTSVPDLERQRAAAEARLLQIDSELESSAKFRTIDDKPATIAELRSALRPGEAFMKIAELSRRTYGIVVTADRSWIYQVDAPNATLNDLAARVRASIDGRLDQQLLVPFDVARSYDLFRLLTGPATEAVLTSSALVIDPAGPLDKLPIGVLVTDAASVTARKAIAKARPFDFSAVNFLARRTTLSTAISPRSFLVARALKPSAAKQAFLGMGEHQAPAPGIGAPRSISVGFGCQVDFSKLAENSRQLTPISKQELVIAANALGVPNAPEITGAAFSDTAVEARTDLADFEVIHFATHGLEEGVWGCAKSPPALVTSFGDASSDGLLSFSEIARLRLDANLVVLSACDTASGVKDEALARRSGQEEAGSTLEGLVRAFLTANSRAVMATMWPVSAEQEADLFIKAFYGAARAKNIGGSLQTAQVALMADPEYSHPFHWGPFFIVGDSTKMMLSGPVAAEPPVTVAAR